MSRPARCRRIEKLPLFRSFSPDDVETAESVFMTVDEFEAMRLLDDEGLTQEACALKMNVARTTVTAIYESARRKVADALICGGIGGGARMALDEAGIALYPGVKGSADEAAKALAAGKLEYDPDSHCTHHEHHDHHEGNCGRHSCGSHHC